MASMGIAKWNNASEGVDPEGVPNGPDRGVPEGQLYLPQAVSGSRGWSQDGVLLERMAKWFHVDLNRINRWDFGIAGSTLITPSVSTMNSWIPPTGAEPLSTGGTGYNPFRFRDIGQNLDPRDSPNNHRAYEAWWHLFEAELGGLVDPEAITRPVYIDPLDGLPIEAWRVLQSPPTGKLVTILHCRGNDLFSRMQEQHGSYSPGGIVSVTATTPIEVTLDQPHPLTEPFLVFISGVSGSGQAANTEANHAFWAHPTGAANKVELYTSIDDSLPVVGNVAGTGGQMLIFDSVSAIPYTDASLALPPELWDATPTQAEALREFVDQIPEVATPDPYADEWAEHGLSGAIESAQRYALEYLWRVNPQMEIVLPSQVNLSLDEPDMPKIRVKRPQSPVPAPTQRWRDGANNWQKPFHNPVDRWTVATATVRLQESAQAQWWGNGDVVVIQEINSLGNVVASQVKTILSVSPGSNTVTFTNNISWIPNPATPTNTVRFVWRNYAWITQGDDEVEGFNGAVSTTAGVSVEAVPILDPAFQSPYVNPDTLTKALFFPAETTALAAGGEVDGQRGHVGVGHWNRTWFAMNNQFNATYKVWGYRDYDLWAGHFLSDRDYRRSVLGTTIFGLWASDAWSGRSYAFDAYNPLDKQKMWTIRHPSDLFGANLNFDGITLIGFGSALAVPGTWAGHNLLVNQLQAAKYDPGIRGAFTPYVLRFLINGVVNRVFRDTLQAADDRLLPDLRANLPGTPPQPGRERVHIPNCWECLVGHPSEPRPDQVNLAVSPWAPFGESRYASGSKYMWLEGVHKSRYGAEAWCDAILFQWLPVSEYMADLIEVSYVDIEVDEEWDLGVSFAQTGLTGVPSTRGERCTDCH
jgi:hypothetical protein